MADSNAKWTRSQLEAIETVGRALLVSAAAGSGKTSVLAERCAFLICDAPEPFRCDVTDLLVVTFTDAAATEMRTRIAAALNARYQKTGDDRLARQLAMIDRAQISTIHSFCSRVIRQHFHVLGLDPNFQMLGEDEGRLLRSEIARDLFADHYEADESGAFQRLIDRYGDGRDESLRQRVIQTHALLGSLARPDVWLKSARARIDRAANYPLKDSTLGKSLLNHIGRQLTLLHERLVRIITALHLFDRLGKYQDFATELLAHLTEWREAFTTGGVDALAARVKDFAMDRLPTISKLSSDEESVKLDMAAVRNAMKAGDIFNLCRFSEQQWRDGMTATLEPANLLLDLVEEFRQRYNNAKAEMRVLDFVDLEQLALQVLGERIEDERFGPTPAALSYRQQFKHVLVDEYQDVNQLQDNILLLVSQDNASNFFSVGDVKQSIYRFRLADPGRFIARYASLKTTGVIDLQTNFRSRAPLLAVLNGLFERLMSKETADVAYDDSHALFAPDDSPYLAQAATGTHVEMHLIAKPAKDEDVENSGDAEAEEQLDQAEREAAFIARRIHDLLHNTKVLAKSVTGQPIERPLKLGDIAILLRSMKFKSDPFVDILRRAGIAAHSSVGSGFFSATEVQDILALLKVLDNRRQDIPLAALLRSPIANLAHPEDVLAQIRLAFPGSAGDCPFHLAVVRYVNEQHDDLAATLRAFLTQLDHWRELAMRRPLAEVLWRIYNQSGYLAFCEGLDDGDQRVANLIALHERAVQFSSFKRQGIGRFLRFLDSLRDEIDDLGQPSVASEADDAVRVMSVHRSKGLEFPVVFVPDLGKRHNLTDSAGHILIDRDAGIGLSVCDEAKQIRYPSLASAIVSERLKKQMLAEELRVLYVATTRARERLILVGTCAADAQEQWSKRWAGHRGAIPADDVLRGNCMLDWIGPAMSAMGADSSINQQFDITLHETVDVEHIARVDRNQKSALREKIARIKPIIAPISAEIQQRAGKVWDRLTREYPFEAFKSVPASASVTSLAHEVEAESSRRESEDQFVRVGEPLRRPRVALAKRQITAAEIGAATHLLLEYLNFTRACDVNDLQKQVERLIERSQLAKELRDGIDLEAIAWFANDTPLGKLLRENAGKLLRELPINFPIESPVPSADPMDRRMARGRVDLLLPLADRIVVVDFKTDRVSVGPELDARATQYRSQLEYYASAMKTMLGIGGAQTHLVFLAPRRIISA